MSASGVSDAAASVLLLGAAVFVLVLLPRATHYDTDVVPPSGRETYAEVLPATVAGADRSLLPIGSDTSDIRGARASYGDRLVIEIMHATSPATLESFVRQRLEPRLAEYRWHEISRKRGRWEAHGRGGKGRFHGWQNRDWLFVIEARDDVAFDEAVERFAYIRHK